jgi:hypothetical protein
MTVSSAVCPSSQVDCKSKRKILKMFFIFYFQANEEATHLLKVMGVHNKPGLEKLIKK